MSSAVASILEGDDFLRLQASVLESMTEGVSVSDERGYILYTNAAEDAMFGYARGELVGQHVTVQNAYGPEENGQKVAAVIEQLRTLGSWEGEWHNQRKDGTGFFTHARITAAELNGQKYWVCVQGDITERKQAEAAHKAAERELLLLVEASSALLASPRSEEVLRTIIGLAQRFVAADGYAVWRKDLEHLSWRLVSSAGLSERYIETGYVAPLNPYEITPFEPLACDDVQDVPHLAHRRESYVAEGIRSMLVMPLVIHGTLAGTVVFYWRTRHGITPAEIRIATALSNLAAAALGTADLYEQQTVSRERAEWSERRAAFLAEAGAVLSSSLDYETTLANVAKLAVPNLADWCSVDILSPSGEVQRVAVQHQDPAKIRFAYEYSEKYPPNEDDLARVALRTGKSVLIEHIPDELIVERARDEEHLRLIRELGLTSVIAAPMVMNGESLGVIVLVNSESGRRFTQSDLQMAEEIARRAATAIAHARLYQDLRRNEERLRLGVGAAGLGIWERASLPVS